MAEVRPTVAASGTRRRSRRCLVRIAAVAGLAVAAAACSAPAPAEPGAASCYLALGDSLSRGSSPTRPVPAWRPRRATRTWNMPSSAALPGYTNLHQAAREIGIKHATLASQIRQLEDVTGTTLLHADPDGIITLTTDGEQFARDVVQVLDARGAGSASRRSRV